jgi:hypothetical protein
VNQAGGIATIKAMGAAAPPLTRMGLRCRQRPVLTNPVGHKQKKTKGGHDAAAPVTLRELEPSDYG